MVPYLFQPFHVASVPGAHGCGCNGNPFIVRLLPSRQPHPPKWPACLAEGKKGREGRRCLACLLACLHKHGGLDFRLRRRHPSSGKNRAGGRGGGEGKGTIMVRLQSMRRQCSAVQCISAHCRDPGWERSLARLSRIHFDCVQNASEHNTFTGCYLRMLRRKRIA